MSIGNFFTLSSVVSKAKSGQLTVDDVISLGGEFNLRVPPVLAPVVAETVVSIAQKVGDGGAAQNILDRVAVVYSDMRLQKAKTMETAQLYRICQQAGIGIDEMQCETIVDRIREYSRDDETLWQFTIGPGMARLLAGATPQTVDVPMISVECPHCGTHARAPKTALGSSVRCESCNNPFFLFEEIQ